MGILDAPGYSKRQVDARNFALSGQRIPPLTRVNGPTFGDVSDGTKQGQAWRFAYVVQQNAHSLEVTFSNFQNAGGPEADAPNPITIFHAFEAPDGSGNIPVTPPGGLVLQPGQTQTLRVGMEVTAGATLYGRTQVYVTALGMKWGLGSQIYAAGDGILDTSAAPGTDITLSASIGSFVSTPGNSFGPSAITGIYEGSPLPSVLIVGTSIAYGIGNTGPDVSYIVRAVRAVQIPHQNIAMPSSSAAMFNTLAGRRRRMVLTHGVRHSHAIWEHITNDAGSQNLSLIQTNTIAGWRLLAARKLKVWACTGVPKTNAANTVTDASNATRVAYNNWLRDGAPMSASFVAAAVGATGVLRAGDPTHPLTGYFEVADAAESARNSGLWKAGYSTDGVHPNATGHTNMTSAIDVSKFTV
jgi:hypothetical protein